MRVLLVDDHKDTRTLCSAVLQVLGHTVVGVPTIAAALAAAEQGVFDLLICDIMLPDGIGYDLMTHLSHKYQIKGIALTGCRTREDIERSTRAGFSRHLAKPFDLSALEHAVADVTAPSAVPV